MHTSYLKNAIEYEAKTPPNIHIEKFEQTSSTRVELQTLISALKKTMDTLSNTAEIKTKPKLTIYSDSQNIIKLPEREEKLKRLNFCSSSGKKLNNGDLYQIFFPLLNHFDYQLVKIKGHQPSKNKSEIDKIFAWVDKASRKALREASI